MIKPKIFSEPYFQSRLKPLFQLLIFLNLLSTVYKISTAGGEVDWGFASLIKMLLVGISQTAVVFLVFAAPLAVFHLLIPSRKYRILRYFSDCCLALLLFIIYFSKISEGLFWQEFGVSFNFIAVDYLIYTHEMLLNIWQTFPVVPLLSCIFLLVYLTLKWLRYLDREAAYDRRLKTSGLTRCGLALSSCVFAVLAFELVSPAQAELASPNRYSQEVAKNDLYSFATAFFSNKLSYREFYLTLDDAEVLKNLRGKFSKDGVFVDSHSLIRNIRPLAPLSRGESPPSGGAGGVDLALTPNVVIVLMESMGYEFFSENGLYKDLTPHLEKIAAQGLYFNNAYATGTRTVRGLEAVSLALPPQTGMSIIRQKNNTGLRNISEPFRQRGYRVNWIYGGWGYFDGMNDFFRGNGFEILDRADIPDEKVTHQTAWGIADEDIFTQALELADQQHAEGKRFFHFVLTTSNHSPYTYPEGRVALPPGNGRPGAVQYSDWAAGDFIERAKKRPWFDDTIFVFIADHGAASAGKLELNAEKHRIPMIFYAPKYLKPQKITRPVSQIDATPTLFGILGWDYESAFMGQDALSPAHEPRIFLSNYQYIGYGDGGEMVVLKPVRQRVFYGGEDSRRLEEAVSFYQYASDWERILK